ncbi:MAG: M23 family metallopeptidase, partial [Bacteroidetes bacterium]
PILENIFVDNLGITIRTAENESVISIFEGKIVTILPQESNTFLLILQHGDYFSIYTPVRNVQVQVEQDVKAGEILGKVCSNEDRIAEIQLQIWYKNPKANAPEKINPEEWLLK